MLSIQNLLATVNGKASLNGLMLGARHRNNSALRMEGALI
jgi:hypothetical protein